MKAEPRELAGSVARMRRGPRRRLLHALLLMAAFILYPLSFTLLAQTPTTNGPIDILSEGGTTYRDRVATATGNVSIQTEDASIYADYAEYYLDKKEALLVGNVRVYRLDTTFFAERAIYNFTTKAVRALDFDAEHGAYYFSGTSVFSPGAGYQFNSRTALFTTHDSSKPDYHLTARRLRIYPDNRAIYVGSTLFIGTTPIFYFPYFYQSLDQQSGYTVSPGYASEYGAYLQIGATFPITDKLTGLLRLDYRTIRGAAAGLDLEWKPRRKIKRPPDPSGLTPYASDEDPGRPALTLAAPAVRSSGTTTAGVTGTNSSSDPDDTSDDDDSAAGNAVTRDIRRMEGAKLITYFTKDDKPDFNRTDLTREPTDPERYRVALSGTQFFTDELYLKANIDKISDRYLLQDFFQGEFTRDPQPDNLGFLAYRAPDFVATLTARAQLNEFFNTTERLPELSLDVPRHPIFGLPVQYESENSAGYLRRSFATDNIFSSISPDLLPAGFRAGSRDSLLPSYGAYRLDTFHQISLPQTFFNWLSVVPRLGIRGTYYSASAPTSNSAFNLISTNEDDLRNLFLLYPNASITTNEGIAERQILDARSRFDTGSDLFRPILNVGVESSFKLSKVYPTIQSRLLGLDKVQHIIQPYINFSYIEDFGIGSRRVLPFDRRLPTTQLDPIDFPQITTIDSIDEGVFTRVGVRNRLQTRRDALTFNWLETDTFFQANIVNPYGSRKLSNLFNQINFRPLPWITLALDTQFPIFDSATGAAKQRANVGTGTTFLDLLAGNTPNRAIGGFTEINTALNLQATSNLEFEISHRYLNGNPFFQNSSLLRFGAYYRLDPNWAVSFTERYEFADRILEAQSYTLHRDLTSFVASLGVTVRNNSSASNRNGLSDYGVLLNFTLKDLPKVNLPIGFDVQSLENQLSGN